MQSVRSSRILTALATEVVAREEIDILQKRKEMPDRAGDLLTTMPFTGSREGTLYLDSPDDESMHL